MIAPGKSPSAWRVGVIAGAFAVLASAMTPAYAGVPSKKAAIAKKKPTTTAPKGGGGAGPVSLEWAISSALRP